MDSIAIRLLKWFVNGSIDENTFINYSDKKRRPSFNNEGFISYSILI